MSAEIDELTLPLSIDPRGLLSEPLPDFGEIGPMEGKKGVMPTGNAIATSFTSA